MASERLFRSQVDSVLSADGRRPVTPASNRITERDTDTTASPGQSARGETSGRAPLMPVRRLGAPPRPRPRPRACPLNHKSA